MQSQSVTPVQDIGPPTNPAYTLRTGTRRVLVDVIVRDKHGNAVHGLKQEDFTVLEDGKPQTIRAFDEHTGLTRAQTAAAPRMPQLVPGEFTNVAAVPANGTLNVILVDRLNTPLQDQVYLQQQLVSYLKHASPDSLTAVYGLNTRLVLLQGFTTDPNVLLRAIQHPTESSLLGEDSLDASNRPISGSNPAAPIGEPGPQKPTHDTVANSSSFVLGTSEALGAAIRSFDAPTGLLEQIRGKYTLDALNQIARTLSVIPGRKNLIWMTGSFPTAFFPNDNQAGEVFAPMAGLEDEFRDTINLLSRSRVAIDAVDVKAVHTDHSNTAMYANHGERVTRAGLGSANRELAEDGAIGAEHLGMEQLATETGGKAYYNNNDLAAIVKESIDTGANYYTFAYAPDLTTTRRAFRHIKIVVTDPSLHLSYRRGYYTEVDGHKTLSAETGIISQSTMSRGALQGAPEPTEIVLRVRAHPLNAGGDQAIYRGNSLNPQANLAKAPFQAFQIDLAASSLNMDFVKTEDGHYHLDLDVVSIVYDGEGRELNAQANTVRESLGPQELLPILKAGFGFTQRLSVPEHGGPHFLRVVVRDNHSDKVGAVEFPVDSVRHLPLLSADTVTAFPKNSTP